MRDWREPKYSHFFRAYRTLMRSWMKHLTPSEFMVLSFIFDRTIGWNKEKEAISLRHIEKGVIGRKNGKNRIWSGGTALDKKTIIKAIRGLQTKKDGHGNVILKAFKRNPRSTRYSINFDWEREFVWGVQDRTLNELMERAEEEELRKRNR